MSAQNNPSEKARYLNELQQSLERAAALEELISILRIELKKEELLLDWLAEQLLEDEPE